MCGATESINGALSQLLTEILTTVGDRADTERFNTVSTEEMMEAMTQLNTRTGELRQPVVFSMDVQAMYPNLHRKTVAKVVASEFLRSDLEVEVDSKELGLYLAILFQGRRRQELEDLGLGEVVQRRRHPRAKPILMTTDEVLSRGQEGDSRFLNQEREPTREEKRLMLSLALQEAVEACMGNHIYSLVGDTLVQEDGGPIGLKLSGAVAKVFMINWCRRFKHTLMAATKAFPFFKLHVLKFYVDDRPRWWRSCPSAAGTSRGR